MDNLKIYNDLRSVPETAKKQITAGRLKGMTDINPVWRIKALTERFGACGDGWGYKIDRLWIEEGAGGEMTANALISLWYRLDNGEKSDPIPGIGGSKLIAIEKNGPYTSDECYKMAVTDAIGVAAKALGVGADVYWQADATKYSANRQQEQEQKPQKPPIICTSCGKPIPNETLIDGKRYSAASVAKASEKKYGAPMCYSCKIKADRDDAPTAARSSRAQQEIA